MADRFFQTMPSAEGARRRARVLGYAVFTLLALHFALVYLAPQFLMIPERSILDPRPAPRPAAHARGAGRGPGGPTLRRDGKRYIWGGERPSMHFPARELRIEPAKLRYGLGREHFEALIDPAFVSADRADKRLRGGQRVLVVSVAGEVKVYPLSLLKRHEVVNDMVGGKPIFAAYCILADLGAVYDRRIAGHTLTFGVSGYTYGEPGVWDGKQAFVLWDRNTESLWWPPIGKAVSGPLVDTPMKVLDQRHWSQTTWGAVRAEHPEARVLKPGQAVDRPVDVPRLAVRSSAATTRPAAATAPATAPVPAPAEVPPTAIAPRWGENARLGGGS